MNNFDVNKKGKYEDGYELYMAEQAREEMMEEAKEEEAIYNKYYQMLTVKEKFDLAESDFLDDDYDPNWYLGPKLFVEARQKEGKGNE